ncbi:hypothetical protein F5Y18DRAFT_213374 [Xylariaceae sp. FL1019]|nr:hypothetical protein F5Y18DRAFT_213374 [Xylariaceae sp. FL1019]
MPSVINYPPFMVSPSSKKRRREDDGEVQIPLYDTLPSPLAIHPTRLIDVSPDRSSSFEASQGLVSAINNNDRLILASNRSSGSVFNVPRKVIPLPVSKKLRLADNHSHDRPYNHYHNHAAASPAVLQPQQSYFSHAHPEHDTPVPPSLQQTRPSITRATSSALTPCHICHRKPTKKTDLDSFADCMGCGRRACFVCIRACQGWLSTPHYHQRTSSADDGDSQLSFTMHDVDADITNLDNNEAESTAESHDESQRRKKGEGGTERSWSGRGHKNVICSQCCVERGSEGDVVCLGCLASMEGV